MIEVRPFRPETELHYLYSSWLHSYKSESRFARPIPKDIFYKHHHDVIEHILEKRKATVSVAIFPEEPDVILGFIVYEPGLLHYVYTKKAFRKNGVARTLLESAKLPMPFTFTHWTYDADEIIHRHPGLVYNPYAI